MIFDCKMEFRGYDEKIGSNGKVYKHANFEDLYGESMKFQLADNISTGDLSRGTIYDVAVEYNTYYQSFKVVRVDEIE